VAAPVATTATAVAAPVAAPVATTAVSPAPVVAECDAPKPVVKALSATDKEFKFNPTAREFKSPALAMCVSNGNSHSYGNSNGNSNGSSNNNGNLPTFAMSPSVGSAKMPGAPDGGGGTNTRSPQQGMQGPQGGMVPQQMPPNFGYHLPQPAYQMMGYEGIPQGMPAGGMPPGGMYANPGQYAAGYPPQGDPSMGGMMNPMNMQGAPPGGYSAGMSPYPNMAGMQGGYPGMPLYPGMPMDYGGGPGMMMPQQFSPGQFYDNMPGGPITKQLMQISS
jgi:hypothetical protein